MNEYSEHWIDPLSWASVTEGMLPFCRLVLECFDELTPARRQEILDNEKAEALEFLGVYLNSSPPENATLMLMKEFGPHLIEKHDRDEVETCLTWVLIFAYRMDSLRSDPAKLWSGMRKLLRCSLDLPTLHMSRCLKSVPSRFEVDMPSEVVVEPADWDALMEENLRFCRLLLECFDELTPTRLEEILDEEKKLAMKCLPVYLNHSAAENALIMLTREFGQHLTKPSEREEVEICLICVLEFAEHVYYKRRPERDKRWLCMRKLLRCSLDFPPLPRGTQRPIGE